jgi:hypothetical protein
MQWQREEWMNSGWVENNSDWKSDGVGDDDKHIPLRNRPTRPLASYIRLR